MPFLPEGKPLLVATGDCPPECIIAQLAQIERDRALIIEAQGKLKRLWSLLPKTCARCKCELADDDHVNAVCDICYDELEFGVDHEC